MNARHVSGCTSRALLLGDFLERGDRGAGKQRAQLFANPTRLRFDARTHGKSAGLVERSLGRHAADCGFEQAE
jgi:hypothetical protein